MNFELACSNQREQFIGCASFGTQGGNNNIGVKNDVGNTHNGIIYDMLCNINQSLSEQLIFQRRGLTACVTRWRVRRENAALTEPTSSHRKLLEKRADSHQSGARIVRQFCDLKIPFLFAYDKSKNTSGFCSAILSNATAGPLGLRLPCSQS